jgi:hypothetical protein
MNPSPLMPNMDLLMDALRAPRPASGERIWYRDQHMRGAERSVDVRQCFRAALIRARELGDIGEDYFPRRSAR